VLVVGRLKDEHWARLGGASIDRVLGREIRVDQRDLEPNGLTG
jgi:hypothetical protein